VSAATGTDLALDWHFQGPRVLQRHTTDLRRDEL